MIGLQNLEFGGRAADIHYSLPKEGDQEKNQVFMSFDCKGSVDLELIDTNEPIDDQQLLDFMSKFGEIRLVRNVTDQPM